MRYLVVGDPHAVVDELSDCEKLVEAVSVLAKKHKPDNIIWLGDLCNNHAILRVEVLAFWRSVFDRFPNSIAIVGNHDMPQSGLGGHALSAFSSIQVIDSPTEIEPGIWALPYMSKEDFEGWMDKNKFKGVFCHQTFQGAKYENGFLAPDGVPTEKFKKKQWAISGHIHAASRIGPVWYVGSPRWRSVSDAGEEKAIHVVDIEAGEYDIVDSLDTSMFCQKIEVIEV
jgi:DNA repair exonuclease SbcCD nuclease subunit